MSRQTSPVRSRTSTRQCWPERFRLPRCFPSFGSFAMRIVPGRRNCSITGLMLGPLEHPPGPAPGVGPNMPASLRPAGGVAGKGGWNSQEQGDRGKTSKQSGRRLRLDYGHRLGFGITLALSLDFGLFLFRGRQLLEHHRHTRHVFPVAEYHLRTFDDLLM